MKKKENSLLKQEIDMLQVIWQIIGLFLFMIAIPFGMGLAVMQTGGKIKMDPVTVLVSGYLVMFATFEVVAVPIVLWVSGENFIYLKWFYLFLSGLLALWGMFLYVKRKKKGEEITFDPVKEIFAGDKVLWCMVLLVLLYILYMIVTHTSFDGDDSYYVAQSLITQNTGTMYTQEPYTGGSTVLDVRHAMAVFTMWIAYLGSMTGIHTTILCHSILPCIILPLVLLVDMLIGKEMLGEKEAMLPHFVLFMEFLFLFGYVSLYTGETFLMTRTWQGKALASNFLFPMGLLLLMRLSKDLHDRSTWILLCMFATAAGLFSSLAVMLSVLLIVCFGFFLMIREKSFLLYVKLGLTCLPVVVYFGIYVMNYFLYSYVHYKK
ncbi:MAG: DUF6077 domain-containing protein [Clostridiales bacterium]|nr:DUF6077 domain-containing protein [Clostridiales bacterium]